MVVLHYPMQMDRRLNTKYERGRKLVFFRAANLQRDKEKAYSDDNLMCTISKISVNAHGRWIYAGAFVIVSQRGHNASHLN